MLKVVDMKGFVNSNEHTYIQQKYIYTYILLLAFVTDYLSLESPFLSSLANHFLPSSSIKSNHPL